MNIKQLNSYDEPRNRIVNLGVEALTTAELLALVIRSGTNEDNAIELSNKILSQISFDNITIPILCKIPGVGKAKASSIVAALELSKRFNESVFNTKNFKIGSPNDCFKYLKRYNFNCKQEELYVICLNSRKEVINSRIIFKGTIDSSIIHPREIFNYALELSSSYIILAHNHPSKNLDASFEDIEVTKRIYECAKFMNIPLLDHIIFSNLDFTSLREQNLF